MEIEKMTYKVVICLPDEQNLQDKMSDHLKKYSLIKAAELHYLHITQSYSYTYMVPPTVFPTDDQKGDIKKFYQGVMESMHGKIGQGEGQFHCLFDDSPKHAAAEFLKTTNPDLVVTATRGKHGFEGIFTSSFTEHLIKFAPCDVLAIRG